MSYGREYLADNAYEIEQMQKKWEDMSIGKFLIQK